MPKGNPTIVDWLLAAIALVACLYPMLPFEIAGGGGGFDEFLSRQGTPAMIDVLVGTVVLLLVLEACRRTTGLALPLVCLLALAYAYYGGYLPQGAAIAHAGVDWNQIISASFIQSTGLYGVPLDVAATYIVLFTIYGAVLDASGASKFFIDLSLAAFRRSRAAPGRTVTLAGFLLGSVSGSGYGDDRQPRLGDMADPAPRRLPERERGRNAGRGGHRRDPLAADAGCGGVHHRGIPRCALPDRAGLGDRADDSLLPRHPARGRDRRPPMEHARGRDQRTVRLATARPVRLSLHLAGADRGVPRHGHLGDPGGVYAIFVQIALSFLDKEHRLTPTSGSTDRWPPVCGACSPSPAVCAAAGVIAAMITRTGLGLQLNSILVNAARGITENPALVLVFTAIFAALAVAVLGLAVPVTASFVISWVIVGPALQDLGVAAPAVAMFVFYFAVLSEVTPPTALASVAASAITGGRVMATMMQTWKYTLPAFLVPFAFVLTDNGEGLLGLRSIGDMAWTAAVSALAVAALAVVTGGWLLRRAGWPERVLCAPAAALLLYLHPTTIVIGAALFAVAIAINLVMARRRSTESPDLSPRDNFDTAGTS